MKAASDFRDGGDLARAALFLLQEQRGSRLWEQREADGQGAKVGSDRNQILPLAKGLHPQNADICSKAIYIYQ